MAQLTLKGGRSLPGQLIFFFQRRSAPLIERGGTRFADGDESCDRLQH